MKYAIKMGQSVVVYPESRHSNVGTTAYIAKNMGRLCKSMNVPVVILSVKGGYLANPFWDELRTRRVPIEAGESLNPGSPGFNPTELQFVGEFLYSLHFSPPV